MTSFADVALIRGLERRIEALEAVSDEMADRIEALQAGGGKSEVAGLRLRLGSLQAQVNALKGRPTSDPAPDVDAA